MNTPLFDSLNAIERLQRRAPWQWLLLGFAFVALAASGYYWWQMRLLQMQLQEQLRIVQTQAQQRQTQRLRETEEQSTPEALARKEALAAISQRFALGWDGVFDVLETAAHQVDAGVSILSLIPIKRTASQLELQVNAAALNPQFMLAYIKHLSRDSRVSSVDLQSQQSEDKEITPDAIRFQIALVIDQHVALSHPTRYVAPLPPQAPTGSALKYPPPGNSPAPAPVPAPTHK